MKIQRTIKTIFLSTLTSLAILYGCGIKDTVNEPVEVIYFEDIAPQQKVVSQVDYIDEYADMYEPEIEVKTIKKVTMSDEDIELLALITMAEAEGESELGQRLVIDTVLNRMDSDHFPDTVSEVIYQHNQFSSIDNGRVDRCYVKEEICDLVREELKARVNHEVIFFTKDNYSIYGNPMFKEGNHCFSSL